MLATPLLLCDILTIVTVAVSKQWNEARNRMNERECKTQNTFFLQKYVINKQVHSRASDLVHITLGTWKDKN